MNNDTRALFQCDENSIKNLCRVLPRRPAENKVKMIDPMPAGILQFISALWLGIFLLWAVSGLAIKQTVRSRSNGRAWAAVSVVMFGWLLLFDEPMEAPAWRLVPEGPVSLYTGLALTILGLGFSVWARFSLGRNWSAGVTVTENHQLARKGAYRIVRHPIYSGFMLATLGTAIAFGAARGLVSFALVALAWGYKSRVEEALMIEEFGGEYQRYQREVKALIPLIW
jgi:protein-S-isoprenylcysteine O-methyltransferase